jgi:hypothetical protein
MKNLKTTLLTGAMALIMNLSSQLEANMCCFDEIKIGGEYLYWDPCGAELDYAVVADDGTVFEADELRTKRICCDADSGFRIYGMIDKLWEDFSVGLIYTHFGTHSHSSRSADVRGIALSTAVPNNSFGEGGEGVLVGDFAEGDWHFRYNVVDLVMSHPLNLSCDPCWHFESFGGLKWMRMKQKKDLFVRSTEDEGGNGSSEFDQHVRISGIGPTFGMCSSYAICDSVKLIGMAAGSVIIGDSRNHDRYEAFNTAGDLLFEQRYKDHNDCVCFSGIHLKTGLSYDTCYCNMQMGFHIGWEYIQWINAPGFTYYESFDNGVRSANTEKNFSLQGLFVGADISF